jgi:hypothetical protein
MYQLNYLGSRKGEGKKERKLIKNGKLKVEVK